MAPIIEKAFAYITHGERILVFSHPGFSEAGIQVPAGTVRTTESPAEAVLREAREETGLQELIAVARLGTVDFDMSAFGQPEVHRRHFYHLEFVGHALATWHHDEPDRSDGGAEPVRFEFFWAHLPDEVPPLIAGHDAFLAKVTPRRTEAPPHRDDRGGPCTR